MTKQEALLLLGAADEHVWEDHLMQQVFDIKQFILKTYHAPTVLRGKAKKLTQWAKAASVLTSAQDSPLFDLSISTDLPQPSPFVQNLIEFYRTYEKLLSTLKFQLLQTNDPYTSAMLVEKMSIAEESRLMKLYDLALVANLKPLPTDVKLSEFINTGEIVRLLLPCQNKQLTQSLLDELPLLNRELDKSLKFSNFTKN
jgi:hypothetical protein